MPRGSGACSTQRGTMPGRAPPRRPRGDPTPGRRRPAPRAPSGHALGPDAVPRRRITDDAATQLLPSSPGRRNTAFPTPEDESLPPLGNTPPSRNVVLGKRRARRPSCVDPRDSGLSCSSGPKRALAAAHHRRVGKIDNQMRPIERTVPNPGRGMEPPPARPPRRSTWLE